MDDWREGKTALECHRYMLENEIECDVSFRVGPDDAETEIIRAHKYMLAARSLVFFSMFYGELKENDTVRVIDVEPAIFRNMLKYIYYEVLELVPGSIVKQIAVCHKYMLAGISMNLERRIDNQSACEIFECGKQFDLEVVAEKARRQIEKHFMDIQNSPQFLSLPQPLLAELLSSDQLVVPSEVDVFNACHVWALNQKAGENTTLRGLLEDCIYTIRFPLMNYSTLVEVFQLLPNLLTAEEENMLLKYAATKQSGPFTSRKRNPKFYY